LFFFDDRIKRNDSQQQFTKLPFALPTHDIIGKFLFIDFTTVITVDDLKN
jgi:hypothetical protein